MSTTRMVMIDKTPKIRPVHAIPFPFNEGWFLISPIASQPTITAITPFSNPKRLIIEVIPSNKAIIASLQRFISIAPFLRIFPPTQRLCLYDLPCFMGKIPPGARGIFSRFIQLYRLIS